MTGFYFLMLLMFVLYLSEATKITVNMNDVSVKKAGPSNLRFTSIDNSHTNTKVASPGNSITSMISTENIKEVEKKNKVYNYFRKAEAVPLTKSKEQVQANGKRSMW